MQDLEFDLSTAFPAMPDDCRAALSSAARSAKAEAPVKRKYPIAVLAAALLTLITTIAIAEGWNVLHFLGIQPDSDASLLVQPVSASSRTGNVTLTINSAISDGEFLIFDWTLHNAAPDTPVYVHLEGVTTNGWNYLYDIGDSNLSLRWLPDREHGSTLHGGYITPLTDLMREKDFLHVEITLGLYTPYVPVCRIDEYDGARMTALQEEGCIVIIDKYPRNYLTPGANFDLETRQLIFPGTERSEIKLSFDLDMKASMASLTKPDRPAPIIGEYVTLSLEQFTVSPLQIRMTAVAAWHDDAPVGISAKFILRDQEGNPIKVKDVFDSPKSYTEMYGLMRPDTGKETIWECSIFSPTSAMPDEATLILHLSDGTELSLPLQFR